MKKGKKVLALLLVIAMVFTALVGCGGSKNANDKESGDMKDRKEIKIAYWLSGLGEQWLKDVIAGFEKAQDEYYVTYTTSASQSSLTSAFGMADMDETDIYFALRNDATEFMEPLNEILEKTAEGDAKPLKEKFNSSYLAYEQAEDGNYYMLTYGGGMFNLYYNIDLFKEAGITQLPRTSDELTVVCDQLNSKNITPLCHFKNGGYYEFMLRLYMAQYDGIDYYINNFLTCTDENGKSPSKDVLTKKDGRYYALKAMEKFITPTYMLTGSTTQSHTEIQTQFLNKAAAMMLNGSWIENEMKVNKGEYNLGAMKIPVLSSIVNQLETVKTESALREVITAVDTVIDGEKKAEDYASGDGYKVGNNMVSAADWNRLLDTRNMIQSNYANSSAFVTKYSDVKEGALKFLEYMYSDEGYELQAKATKCPMPMTLSTGEQIDTTDMSDTQKQQFTMSTQDTVYVDMSSAKEHKIFTVGGASLIARINYVDKFSSGNKDDRMSADEVWELMLKTIDENYENNWLANIKEK